MSKKKNKMKGGSLRERVVIGGPGAPAGEPEPPAGEPGPPSGGLTQELLKKILHLADEGEDITKEDLKMAIEVLKDSGHDVDERDKGALLKAAEDSKDIRELLSSLILDGKPGGSGEKPGPPAGKPGPPAGKPEPPTPEQGSGGSVREYPEFRTCYRLGSGSFGKVYLVQKIGGDDNGNFYALKTINKTKTSMTKRELRNIAVNERNFLEVVTNKEVPFCTRIHYSFQTIDNYCIVQPYIAGEEFFYVMREYGSSFFTTIAVIFYAAQITLALERLHELNIVHRDIKPENIMIDSDGYLVVIDLGLAAKCEEVDVGLTDIKGTPEYMAPEMAIAKVNRGNPVNYGKAIDWWALGTLIYELMTGIPPFYDDDRREMYKKIVGSELIFDTTIFNRDEDAPKAENLLWELLDRNPLRRLTDPVRIRNHPFFKIIEWDRLLTKDYKPPYLPPYLPPTFKGLPGEKIRDNDHEDLEFKYFEKEGLSNPNTKPMQSGQGEQGGQGGGSISSAKKIGAPYTRERSNAIYS